MKITNAFFSKDRKFSFALGRVCRLFFSISTILILAASVCQAVPITLAWDRTPDADLAGYRVYSTTTPGTYSFGSSSPNLAAYIPAGTERCTIVGEGEQYFVVTAVDANDNESLPSNEAAWTPNGWRDYRFSVRFRSDDNDAIGAMFRYRDKYNYYRFAWDTEGGYRRLIKREKGKFKILAEDSVPYQSGRIYELDIVAQGPAIKVYIDGDLVLSATDTPARGTVALYSWQNDPSYFADAEIVDLNTGDTLLTGDFTNNSSADWKYVDEGTDGGNAKWSVWRDVLVQRSDSHTPPAGNGDVGHLGTYALYNPDADSDNLPDFKESDHGSDPHVADTDGDGITDGVEAWWNSDPADILSIPEPLFWRNYTVEADFGSIDDDALGVLFRYQDSQNYYRFTWNREEGYRRLEKCVNGVFTELFGDSVVYNVRQKYHLKITLHEGHITIEVDGIPFDVWDDSIKSGSVALYSHGSKGACFDNLLVTDFDSGVVLDENFNDKSAEGWKIDDQGLASYPSKWMFKHGLYVQYSDIMTPADNLFDIAKFGSYSFYSGN